MKKSNKIYIRIDNYPNLNKYFLVDSNYIIWKLKKLLIPFFNYDCIPNQIESNSTKSFFYPPKLIYPELFLPLLSFLFYVFLTTLYRMSKNHFLPSPDVALSIMLKNISLIILESIIIKTLLSISNNNFIPLMDLICFTSNKFVTLSFCSLFAYIKLLFYFYTFYSIFINILNMEESINIQFNRKKKSLLLSFIYILSDIIVLIDLI